MGQVAPKVRKPEGPFGDHYGYYSLQHDYPVFDVRQIAHRRDAIYPATVVGKPRQEDFFIGDLLQDLLSPLFPLVMPAVEQLWSYGETGYHSLAGAVVKQRYKREAMASAFRILGEGQLSLTKFILLTDRLVDLKDFRATLEHVLARTNPQTDLYVFSNLSMDTLDYTGPVVNEGSKGVWLGLGDPIRELPRTFAPPVPPPSDVTDVRVYCGGCLVVGARSFADDRDAPSRIASHPAFAGWPLIVVSDEPARATRSDMNFLWTTFTRFEPAADIHAASERVVRHHLAYEPPIVIDARMKPWYPKEVTCDPDTAATVTNRWKEYFPAGNVAMGDSERGHLGLRSKPASPQDPKPDLSNNQVCERYDDQRDSSAGHDQISSRTQLAARSRILVCLLHSHFKRRPGHRAVDQPPLGDYQHRRRRGRSSRRGRRRRQAGAGAGSLLQLQQLLPPEDAGRHDARRIHDGDAGRRDVRGAHRPFYARCTQRAQLRLMQALGP